MKLKIQPLCVLYFLSIALFASVRVGIAAVAALLVHEAAHLMVGYALGERAESLEFTPFGGIIRYPAGTSSKKGLKGIAIAAAGPLANYGMVHLFSSQRMQAILPNELGRQIVLMNAAILMLNMLPVLPLDGGRMVFCAGYYVFPVGKLITVLSIGGVLLGTMMIMLGVYGAIEMGKLNLSLPLVGGYLMVCAYQNRSSLWLENLYAVLQERQTNEKKPAAVQVYRVQEETKLVTLIGAIAENREVLFRTKGKWIEEDQILSAMMMNPNATIAEAIEK